MKIVLINLPREGEARDYTTRDYLLTDFSKYPPLGLMAIATEVDPRHQVVLHDANIKDKSVEETVNYIKDQRPDVLGLSVVTRRLYAMREVARRVKQELPRTKIIAGGPHINYWPEESMGLNVLDYALPGFGERTFPQLIEAIEQGEKSETIGKIPGLYYRNEGGFIHGNLPALVDRSLDDIPFPNRTLLDLNNYYTAVDQSKMTTTYSSRGCPFRCVFCDVQEKLYHYRSAQSVVDEFETIVDLGIKEIHIFDDIFNVRPKRVVEICDEIKKRNIKVRWSVRARINPFTREMVARLKDAGCGRLHLGVESLDPATLEYMNKKQTYQEIQEFFKICHEEGMETLAYFIIGFPTESPEYRQRFFDEVMKLDPTYCFFNILFPLAKTQYYQSLRDDGTFEKDYWEEYCKNPTPHFEIPLPRSPELQQELEDLADSFHRRFCYRFGFLARELWRSIRYPRILFLKARLTYVLARETVHWRRKKGGDKSIRYIGSDATHVMH
jgi:radical SAM superfamily enzyme YgiQ (UPF0313 family)